MALGGSLNNRSMMITGIILVVVVLGYIGMVSLGPDMDTNSGILFLSIITTCSGSEPAAMERHITAPIEKSIMTVSGIRRISSQNIEGMSIITMEFSPGHDVNDASRKVRERVAALRGDLPDKIGISLICERADPVF